MRSAIASLAFVASCFAIPAKDLYAGTTPAVVYANRAIASTTSPTSNVKGKAFDRFVVIWMENTDYDMAAGDPNLAWLAKQGITLDSYHAVTHPSEPNYVASIGGDYFGMQNDDFNQITANISTVVDLLEEKNISWGHYQEDMPFSGFEGMAWVNQKTGANDYVRKHNPAVIFNANANYLDRLSNIKNKTMFYRDLANNALPQWMFITPNMTSDGHDTDVSVAGAWTRNFLEPLLNDSNFMQNTMVLVTFDETETYTLQNRIFAFLLGDAVPTQSVGTTDTNYYNHYSEIATVCANWDLHTLGRFDVGANVFQAVAEKTGDTVRPWDGAVPLADRYFNVSYAGVFNEDGGSAVYPAPNLSNDGLPHNRTLLPSIRDKWATSSAPMYYHYTVATPDGMHPPQGFAPPYLPAPGDTD